MSKCGRRWMGSSFSCKEPGAISLSNKQREAEPTAAAGLIQDSLHWAASPIESVLRSPRLMSLIYKK